MRLKATLHHVFPIYRHTPENSGVVFAGAKKDNAAGIAFGGVILQSSEVGLKDLDNALQIKALSIGWYGVGKPRLLPNVIRSFLRR